MPEFPEMEAWRRQLNDPVSAFPIVQAGPAHIATLKTYDPPLSVLEGRKLAGAERRAKRLMFPTDEGELVVLVHLMTAGRLKYLRAGEHGPKTPAFQLMFEGGARLVLTEAGSKKRAGVWLLAPEAVEAELAHLGPEAFGLGPARLGEIVRGESRRLHSLLRDQRVIAGIGRAWANEILHTARLSPFALSRELSDEDVERLAAAVDSELERGLELRERGAGDKKTYRVHDKLGEPCHVCGGLLLGVVHVDAPARNVAEADDAHRPLGVHDRQVAEVALQHDVRRLRRIRVRGDEHGVGRHPLPDAGLARVRPVRDRLEDVALGQDADDPAEIRHDHGADAPLGHLLGRLADRVRRLDREDVPLHDLRDDGHGRQHKRWPASGVAAKAVDP